MRYCIIFLVLLILTSCQKLDLDQKGIVPTDEAIVDLASAQVALNGCYAEFRNVTGFALISGPGQYGKDLRVQALDPDLVFFTSHVGPDNNANNTVWRNYYRAINAANHIISEVEELSVRAGKEPQRQQILGEARFIRAFQYLHMIQFYGAVPLQRHFTENPEDQNLAPASMQEIYTFVENELQQAAQELSGQELYRASPGAANALLSRAYLYQEKWGPALQAAEKVMDEYPYALQENFADVFEQLSSGEGIFYLDKGGLADVYATGFYVIVADLDSLYQTADERPPRTYQGNIVQKYFRSDRNDPFYIFRYAEVLLNAAEAAGELGEFNKANKFYEQIRQRAGINAPTLDASNFKDSLLAERWRELIFEGPHRFIDVKRMGKMEEFWGYPPYKHVWAIPQQEIDNNPSMTQNQGY